MRFVQRRRVFLAPPPPPPGGENMNFPTDGFPLKRRESTYPVCCVRHPYGQNRVKEDLISFLGNQRQRQRFPPCRFETKARRSQRTDLIWISVYGALILWGRWQGRRRQCKAKVSPTVCPHCVVTHHECIFAHQGFACSTWKAREIVFSFDKK